MEDPRSRSAPLVYADTAQHEGSGAGLKFSFLADSDAFTVFRSRVDYFVRWCERNRGGPVEDKSQALCRLVNELSPLIADVVPPDPEEDCVEGYACERAYQWLFCSGPDDIDMDALFDAKATTVAAVAAPEDIAQMDVSLVDLSQVDRAADELTKMSAMRAPKDKLDCVVRCCRELSKSVQGRVMSAEDLLSLLSLSLTRRKLPALHSNIEYINRFRNPEALEHEAEYCMVSLQMAVQVIEDFKPALQVPASRVLVEDVPGTPGTPSRRARSRRSPCGSPASPGSRGRRLSVCVRHSRTLTSTGPVAMAMLGQQQRDEATMTERRALADTATQTEHSALQQCVRTHAPPSSYLPLYRW
eukprot:m51a1_g10394 hypothetical protein (358) ;mRNA; f:62412-63985